MEESLRQESVVKVRKSRRNIKLSRPAYLRLKVRVIQFKQIMTISAGIRHAAMFAQLEGYEIYADTDKQKLLYKYDIKSEGRNAARRYLLNSPFDQEDEKKKEPSLDDIKYDDDLKKEQEKIGDNLEGILHTTE